MDYAKRAVSHTQDWSDPKRELERIEQATAARERRAGGTTWFDKLVKRGPEPAGDANDEADVSPPANRKASPKRRATRKR